ncbi:hypothetical protein [Necropsobacter massiliensis]|uniref:hypothetical protein n=1 Tax=Necropsobacter massiliensis TaxID=1400001 RepID=UPI000694C0D3|nr:hypothetical protein [Necropsobacter massiliensis]
MSLQSLLYEMHGYRVKPMTREEIVQVALPIAKYLKFTEWHKQRSKFEWILETLNEIVNIEIFSEQEWNELTKGLTQAHYSPNELTIRTTEKTYQLACQGDRDALGIILHELGHMFLMHQTYLHKSNEPPTINENPEWQADTFAEVILESMGYQTKQLSLNFESPEM